MALRKVKLEDQIKGCIPKGIESYFKLFSREEVFPVASQKGLKVLPRGFRIFLSTSVASQKGLKDMILAGLPYPDIRLHPKRD